MSKPKTILAFDVGGRRIGIAKAVVPPRVAQPLTAVTQGDSLEDNVAELVALHQPDVLVVGRPRNQQGDATAQTKAAEDWADRYLARCGLPIKWQDESVTSVTAETRLRQQGKAYSKADIDAMAASIILTDFLES